jgi:hypothetical protein
MQKKKIAISVSTKSQAPCLPEHANAYYLNHCVLITVTKMCLQNSKFNYFNTCNMHLLLFCTMTTNVQLIDKVQ